LGALQPLKSKICYIYKTHIIVYNVVVNLLQAKRKELGLSQVDLAYAMGTKQSNISAYERGVLEPGSVIEQRLHALLQLNAQSAFCAGGVPTLASQVVELRNLLAMPRCKNDSDQDSIILRVIIDSHDRFAELDNQVDQQFYLMQPGSVGLHRADVALAGMAVHWSRQAGLPRVPNWTKNPDLFLLKPWFVDGGTQGTLLETFGVARGVPALRARGVFLAATNLDSI